ncbi:MAG: DUF763 domain-containing protein [Chloroflexi bacterium]|nr:MAG: DUF763 domain-containing protein [Chloroflexota bacterium]
MRTGTADLPLHGGRAPRWLFERMTLLAREMGLAILSEEGTPGLMRRIADPVWFQAFGCVLGFDWHSSGLTTTACGALKEGLRDLSHETGLFIAGGKGKTSRKTPQEIEAACWKTGQDAAPLIRASRLSAKVDSAAVQDGFQVYHHSFFFATDGSWAVVQQGMNEGTGMARRYHWLPPERFDSDPHAAITGDAGQPVLNLVASEAEANRTGAVSLAREKPITLLSEMTRMRTVAMPRHHEVRLSDLHPERLARVLLTTYERQPEDYTALLAVPGVGAKALRALALVAELTYGEPASVRDPVSYSFAHGGKDGTPYPVDRPTYDATIESLRRAVNEARAGHSEKSAALRRLAGVERSLTAVS